MTLTVPAHDPAARDKPAGRIRQKNEEAILAAAEEEFARHGFKGTSMNTIAQNVGLPKANLHYYFGNKLGLYTAVLSNILELWDSTFNTLGVDDDPAEALARYIRAKMEFSRRYPLASRIFAMEIISGGECLTAHFNQDYRSWFRGRAAVFEAWIAAGRMDPVDPVHLIFLLWGSTQHYADFASQIGLVTGRKRMSRQDFAAAADNLVRIILKGCGLTRRRPERDAEHPARPRRIPRGNPQEPLPHHRRAGGRRGRGAGVHRRPPRRFRRTQLLGLEVRRAVPLQRRRRTRRQRRAADPGGHRGTGHGLRGGAGQPLVRWHQARHRRPRPRLWRRRGQSACSRRRAASWSSAVGCASPVPSPTTRCSRRAAWRWAPAWRPKTTAPTASS